MLEIKPSATHLARFRAFHIRQAPEANLNASVLSSGKQEMIISNEDQEV
jgi:hypothetical protein